MTEQQIVEGVLALAIAMIGWFLKRLVKQVDDHVQKCDATPKSLIIEKIDNLCEKFDTAHEQNTKRFDKIEAQVFEIATGKFRAAGADK